MLFYQKFTYVFIVTYGRSGSTLLQSVLNASGNCDIKGENNAALYYLYRSIALLKKSKERFQGQKHMTGSTDTPWYGIDQVGCDAFREKCLDAFVVDVLRPSIDQGLIGFKEIRYMPRQFMTLDNGGLFVEQAQFVEFCDFLLSFPQGKIIFNTRDASDVVKSGMWKYYNTENVQAMIGMMDQWFAQYHHANPEQTQLLKYEEYTHNQEPIRKMLEFLGVPVDQQVLDQVMSTRLTH